MTRVSLELYQHEESEKALLLSRDGNAHRTQWIPRSLIDQPQATKLVNVNGVALQHGSFSIEKWKLDEIDWLDEGNENQMELL